MKKEVKLITIDGPASSGKTTTARLLLKKLKEQKKNFVLLESGNFYRFATYLLLKKDKLNSFLENPSEEMSFFKEEFKNVKIELRDQGTFIFWKGRLIKEELRNKEVEDSVSLVSAVKEMREFLNEKMKELVKGKSVIAEGRDMGSVVFPEADLKVYLTADEKLRAERRFREKKDVELKEVEENIKKRDELDSRRKVAPLTIPEGAVIIDTGRLSPEKVVQKILSFIN
jgi:cytidylate kinase